MEKEVLVILDSRNNFVLEFIDYTIDPPRYSIEECIERGLTYKVPLKAKLKLGSIHEKRGDDAKAKTYFEKTIEYCPMRRINS